MSQLYILRHGQSIWNEQNRFTGWVDVGLSEHGVLEAQRAAELLADIDINVTFTSCLQRAQYTLNEVLRYNRKCKGFQYRSDQRSNWYESHLPAKDDGSTLTEFELVSRRVRITPARIQSNRSVRDR